MIKKLKPFSMLFIRNSIQIKFEFRRLFRNGAFVPNFQKGKINRFTNYVVSHSVLIVKLNCLFFSMLFSQVESLTMNNMLQTKAEKKCIVNRKGGLIRISFFIFVSGTASLHKLAFSDVLNAG